MKNNERKNQLIKAASKRFSRLGYHKTTLEEVARDIRIGKATIYHYFKSKDELYQAVLEFELSEMIESIKNIFNNEEISISDRFLNYFNIKQNIFVENKTISNLMLRKLLNELTESEVAIIDKLFNDDIEIIKLLMNFLHRDKIEKYDEKIPFEIVHLSWIIAILKSKTLQKDFEKNFFNEARLKRIIETLIS
jgi:AcrR family transcriptional regulator